MQEEEGNTFLWLSIFDVMKKDRAMVAFMEFFLPYTWVYGYLIPYNASAMTILEDRDKEGVLLT